MLLTLAPNQHGEQEFNFNPFQGKETRLRSCFGPEEVKPAAEEHTQGLGTQTDKKFKDTGQSANQQTLLSTLSSDWDQLDLEKGKNVISLHC